MKKLCDTLKSSYIDYNPYSYILLYKENPPAKAVNIIKVYDKAFFR